MNINSAQKNMLLSYVSNNIFKQIFTNYLIGNIILNSVEIFVLFTRILPL